MTPRQKKLLKAIIEEFIETAEAVGSLSIPSKYHIDASPATIRNEMARLVQSGHLEKPHASSGRVPTTSGLKYYLSELIDELEELDVVEELELNESFHQLRHDKVSLIRRAVDSLHSLSNNTSIILFNNHIYISGLSDLIAYREFSESQRLKEVLDILENYSKLLELFNTYDGNDIKILIGEETGFNNLQDLAVVYTPIKLYQSVKGFVGIVGPNRINYSRVIPAVRFVANSLESAVKGW